VLGARESDGFSPSHSTALYPEWPFAKLRHTPRQLSQDVAVALLTLPEDDPVALAAGSAGWTIPLDYSAVHQLFRELNIGPYAASEEVSLSSALRALAPWLAGSAVVVVLMAVATIYVTGTNRRLAESDQALRREIGERRQAQEALARHRDTLEEHVVERTEALARLNVELQQDILARTAAEDALRRSDVALRELSEATGNPVFDYDQKIDRILRAGMRYFDVASACLVDVTGEPYRALHTVGAKSGEDAQTFALAAQIAASGEPVMWQESSESTVSRTAVRRYAAAPVVVEDQLASVISYLSPTPVMQAFTAVDLDILQLMALWIGREIERARTEERAAVHEAELNHFSRLNVMGELATGLAHEINQPLTAIANYTRGCMHRLRSESFEREAVLNAMELAVGEAERAGAIIRHLREFLGDGDAEVASVCLNQSVDAVLRLAGPEARRRRITISIMLATDLPRVTVNAIQIEQVILNILNNAIEAIAGAGSVERTIRMSTCVEGDSVSLTVSDTGPGLSASDTERLFDPFYTTKSTGMGLGLPISRSIVVAAGGELIATNNAVDGATFHVSLPMTSDT